MNKTKKKSTIIDVSKLAGVSNATVSRVLNGNDKVSEENRAKVLDAMNKLGFKPNVVAQSLASKRTSSVGVLVAELHGPFYGSMMSGLEATLRKSGKHAIITTGHSDAQREREGIEFLISRKCDALILYVEAVSDDYLIELAKHAPPFVLINRDIPELKDQTICLNNEQGGYLATKALLENGHKDIAYVSGPLWKSDAMARLSGHKRALNESGLSFNEELLSEGDFREAGGREAMGILLDKKQAGEIEFTAVACANDEMASGAMKAAREHNLKIPDELSFVGFDNVIIAQYLYPSLSTIDYPVDSMGHEAATWVLKHVYDIDNLDVKKEFEPEFIPRDSIKQLA